MTVIFKNYYLLYLRAHKKILFLCARILSNLVNAPSECSTFAI